METKTVLVEMPADVAEWLELAPLLSLSQVRVMGRLEGGPMAAKPNKVVTAAPKRKQEFPKGTRLKCQHRPPEGAPQRRKVWDHLRDKFGDMVITAKDARESLAAAGMQSSNSLVSQMLKLRELKPVTE